MNLGKCRIAMVMGSLGAAVLLMDLGVGWDI
jgi:hypothetical protein